MSDTTIRKLIPYLRTIQNTTSLAEAQRAARLAEDLIQKENA